MLERKLMTQEERERRSRHYMRLEFDYAQEDLYDDELWEKAKNLPIDPNNKCDRMRWAVQESENIELEHLRLQRVSEMLGKVMKEAKSRKQLSKKELLKLINQMNELKPDKLIQELQKEIDERSTPKKPEPIEKTIGNKRAAVCAWQLAMEHNRLADAVMPVIRASNKDYQAKKEQLFMVIFARIFQFCDERVTFPDDSVDDLIEMLEKERTAAWIRATEAYKDSGRRGSPW